MDKNPYDKFMQYNGIETPFVDSVGKKICCGDSLEIKRRYTTITGVVSKNDAGEFILIINMFTTPLLKNFIENMELYDERILHIYSW